MSLIINNHTYTSISGPVQMFILKPKNNFYPLIILLSDLHQSSENICNNSDIDTSILNIYSNKFHQELDILVDTYNKPIDFFY